MKKVEESLSRTIIGGDFHWRCSLHNVGNNSKADCLRHIQLYQVRISHADHIKHMTMHE